MAGKHFKKASKTQVYRMSKQLTKWIDSHSHFQDIPDQKTALEHAVDQGVETIVCNGLGLASNRKIQALSRKYSAIHPCFGIDYEKTVRQTEAENQQALAWMEQTLEQNKNADIGEIGLDYKVAQTPAEQKRQAEWFEKQLDLAERFNRSVCIHTRQAVPAVLAILERKHTRNVLLHWFDATPMEVQTAAAREYLVSVSPAVLFQAKIQTIAEQFPLDQLLLETDCPVPFQGQNSEPAWIPRIGAKIASLRNEKTEKIAQKTTQNAQRFFNLRFSAKTDF